MTPETEVLTCPACRHTVRIPTEWLGQAVACPECKATFTAPKPGEAGVILTRQPDANAVPPRSNRALWLPSFALMLLGVVSLVVNSMTLASILTDREGFEAEKKMQAEQIAKTLGQNPTDVGAATNWPTLIGLTAWGAFCGAASFGGGLAIALRRWYWLARAGSVLAVLNLPGFCCVPGAIAGGWAWMMLRSEEGRAHFG